MKTMIFKITSGVALILLGLSYCLFIYMFVSDDTFLDNWISRLAAIVNVFGVISAASFWKFVKDKLPYSLWLIALVVSVATGFQAMALLKLHGITATVEVIGAARETLATDMRVTLQTADRGPRSLDWDSTTAENEFIFRSDGGVLVWNRPATVLAEDTLIMAMDSRAIEWQEGSFWDVFGEREVTLQLRPSRAMVSIIANPSSARIRLTAYSDRDRVEFPEFSGVTPHEVAIGDRITIEASNRGFKTLHDNYGLERITGDTEIPIALQARPTEVMVEAYNVGLEPESTAYVILDSKLTPYKAFEKFTRPWGNEHTVVAELVGSSGLVFRSKVQSVTLIPDNVNSVKCVLEAVR